MQDVEKLEVALRFGGMDWGRRGEGEKRRRERRREKMKGRREGVCRREEGRRRVHKLVQ